MGVGSCEMLGSAVLGGGGAVGGGGGGGGGVGSGGLALARGWGGIVSSVGVGNGYSDGAGLGSEDEEQLLIDRFRGYNHLIRPVHTVNATPIIVSFGVAMILLINVVREHPPWQQTL